MKGDGKIADIKTHVGASAGACKNTTTSNQLHSSRAGLLSLQSIVASGNIHIIRHWHLSVMSSPNCQGSSSNKADDDNLPQAAPPCLNFHSLTTRAHLYVPSSAYPNSKTYAAPIACSSLRSQTHSPWILVTCELHVKDLHCFSGTPLYLPSLS